MCCSTGFSHCIFRVQRNFLRRKVCFWKKNSTESFLRLRLIYFRQRYPNCLLGVRVTFWGERTLLKNYLSFFTEFAEKTFELCAKDFPQGFQNLLSACPGETFCESFFVGENCNFVFIFWLWRKIFESRQKFR